MAIELAPGVYTVDRGKPVVYIPSLKAIVLADLHLGFEEEAAAQGYYIPHIQLRRSLDILGSALDATGAEWVIFAGDVKHCFSRLLRSERQELEELFTYLNRRGVRVTVVRGNHDNYLPIVAKKYDVEIVQELYAEGYLVIHGHRRPQGSYPGRIKAVIMGHEHPSIRLRDKIGYIVKAPCFLTAPYEPLAARLVVLPAIGQYQTGTSVTLDPSTYLSPLLREDVDLTRVKPYILAEDYGIMEFPELGLLEDLLTEVVL